ncbi:Gag-pol fusion protein [Oopsacas minuta]|uniref:Gag-pol fusion protein n=1 Tax=Oopsacas minuta TaxID=111878 RepID=A0AAV7KFW4_9METZ|nr:Gag-pol fusion protein [Oopsacas minuta]
MVWGGRYVFYIKEKMMAMFRTVINVAKVDYRTWRTVVRSCDEGERVLESCHSSDFGGHFGRDKTYEKVAARFYWPNMYNDVRKYVAACDICQRVNESGNFIKAKAPLHPIKVDPEVWKMVGVDLIGPLTMTPRGNKYIITMVDYFSKWPEADALPDKSAKGVALFLYKTMCRFGCTQVVISDQGREFVNKVNQELFDLTKTTHRISTAYHPQTNGLVERFNQTIQRALLKLVIKEQDNWDMYIDGVLFAYRTSVQKTTKKSPFEIMYLREAILPIEMDFMPEYLNIPADPNIDAFICQMNNIKKSLYGKVDKNIQEGQEKQKNEYDKKQKQSKNFKPGTLVLLRNSAKDGRKGDKFRMRYLGPYEIFQDIGKGVYKLRNCVTGILLKKTQNISRLKLYCKKKFQIRSNHVSGYRYSKQRAMQTGIVESENELCEKEPKEELVISVDRKDNESINGTISSSPPSPSPFWVHNLYLSPTDELEILNGLWLTDKHIVAAQKLLKNQHPLTNGLEDPLMLAEKLSYKSTSISFVQIVNLGRTHWVCVSSFNCLPGIVDVYDSIPACSLGSLSLRKQVASIIKATERSFELHFVETQRQSGGTDCGLFSIAFATALCQGIDPHTCSFDQTQMRIHLHSCLEQLNMTLFPSSKKPRRKCTKRWQRKIVVAN